jgi:AraC family transcriptional regulator of adaptative response / DNA-3-methyladenine glycosylase II
MNLDAASCYRALVARDARFDGLFFVGVITTGIYCRPVCTARTPGRDRCRFFASAAAAEREKFRPCLRCRPELAPGNAPVDASSRMASAVVARIEAGALDNGGSLEQLAHEVGLCSRQLRRIVRKELGVSPVQLAQTHRLLLAKQLLTDTRLPIIDVAFASGFSSVRRFNALFRSHYRLTPGRLRHSAGTEPGEKTLRLRLAYRPPLAWAEMLHFLSARALTGVESICGQSYARTVVVGKHRGWLRVEPVPGRAVLAVEFSAGLAPVLPPLLARLRNLFDLNVRPDVITSHLSGDDQIGLAVRRCPGLRVPGSFCGFELALRAILGQQVSVRAATTVAGRVVAAFGKPIDVPSPGLTHLSPAPDRIAGAKRGDLTRLGITAARAECIQALARAVVNGRLTLEPGPNPETAVQRLMELPGIGEWTANYIAMRALRWPDAFPHADLGLSKGLGKTSSRQVRAAAEVWRPWRAYAAMHIWHTLNRPEENSGHV